MRDESLDLAINVISALVPAIPAGLLYGILLKDTTMNSIPNLLPSDSALKRSLGSFAIGLFAGASMGFLGSSFIADKLTTRYTPLFPKA